MLVTQRYYAHCKTACSLEVVSCHVGHTRAFCLPLSSDALLCKLPPERSERRLEDKKDHTEIRQFTKFEVLSLDCNHVEGSKKSEILETLHGFGSRHLTIRDICMEFGRTLTDHSLVTSQ